MSRRLIPHCILCLAIWLWQAGWVAAHASAPVSGSLIDNQASVHYVDFASGQQASLDSNAVRALVQDLVQASVNDAPGVQVIPGMEVAWPFQVRNIGNVATTFRLLAANVAGADFNVVQIRVIHDLNRDGVASAGEPDITDVLLTPGETAYVVVLARAPGTAPVGRTARISLRAVLGNGSTAAQGTSQATSGGGPVLSLTQAVSAASAAFGQELTFGLLVSNAGGDAMGVPTTIDGASVSRVLIAWPVPAGASLLSGTGPSNATTLFHLSGAPSNSYVSTAPADMSQVDAMAFAFSTFASGSVSPFSARVRVVTHSGTLSATASASFTEQGGSTVQSATSNRSDVTVQGDAAVLRFYTAQAFDRIARAVKLGTPLFIQAQAASCNLSPGVVDTVTFRVTSMPTGDSESYVARETGPDTGVFRSLILPQTISADQMAATSGDNWLQMRANDTVTATLEGCATPSTPAAVLVDPFGVVFDSRTDLPVAGTRIDLIDVSGAGNGGQAGALARVFQSDGVTVAPASVVTSGDGSYRFPQVSPSTYRLQIVPPTSHTFPSTVPFAELPSGRAVDTSGSYGGTFVITSTSLPVHTDVPIDIKPGTGLMLEKTASRNVAELGDFIDYTVQVRNVSSGAISDAVLVDTLPRGLAYMPGSLRRDGVAQPDPTGGRGPGLRFAPFALAQGATARVSYRVRIEATAPVGDAVNQVQATSAHPLPQVSNVAQARVRIEGGVFDTRGFIVGNVYADCNRNGVQDGREPGLPGVRVWLEDGTFAITDGAGQYSLYGISARTHVAKLDPATLPAGVTPMATDSRNAGDGHSRFIDMKNGELVRADFAVTPCGEGLDETIAKRRARQDQPATMLADDMQGMARDELPLDMARPSTDPRALSASGILPAASRLSMGLGVLRHPDQVKAGEGAAPRGASTSGASANNGPAPASSAPDALATLADTLDAQPGFIEPSDGAVLGSRQTRVRLKSLMGAPVTLSVNGRDVPDSRVGTHVERADRRLSLTEYVGVDLHPGDNTLTLTQRDPFGQVRATHSIHVSVPGELARIVIELGALQADADGGNSVPVTLRLEDAKGLRVAERTPVTLNSALGTWLTPDLNPAEPGWQVFIEGGLQTIRLRVPDQTGTDTVTALSGRVQAQARLQLSAPLRDMVGVGVIEGMLNLRGLKGGALQTARANDGFEQALSTFARDGDRSAGGRTALFLKGRVRGDSLLTLAYDSDKDTRQRLFRDIQPDQFYPVYGDASVKGYDAQSTSKLYVRIDKDKSWLLHGDFTTPPATPERKLSAYARSLTGLRHHYEDEDVRVDTFASRDNTQQVVEELAGNGTSGPYLLAHNQLLENSERVEIVTRDRHQSSRVIDVKPQARFTDYELEPYSGRILFRAPVPSLDADLNPVSVRISYEIEQGGPAFWVVGAEVQATMSRTLSLGVNQVNDRNPEDPYGLRGANVVWHEGSLTVTTEVAESHRDSLGTGQAQRIEIDQQDETFSWHVYAARTDARFDNPGALLSKGRQEASAKMSYTLDARTRIVVEAIHSSLPDTGELREGGEVAVQRSLDGGMKLELGLRSVRERAGDLYATSALSSTSTSPSTLSTWAPPGSPQAAFTPATEADPSEVTSVHAKLSTPVPGVPQATAFIEGEQAIGDEQRRMVGVGGDYRFSDTGRLYGRYEFISSLSSAYDLNAQESRNVALLGIDGQYMADGRAFSEYRARDALDGRQTEASMGLKNGWRLDEGLRLSTSLERVRALSNASATREATAVTGGLTYTASPDWKGSTRLEYRYAPDSRNVLATAGLAIRLDDAWTAMMREIINLLYARQPGRGDRELQRFQVGAAWRDKAHIWTWLTRYERKNESDTTPDTGFKRSADIVSNHLNMKARRDLVISARYAIKLGREDSLGLDSRSVTQLLASRLLYDLDERWDMGLQASRLFTSGGAAQQGLGAELGYRVYTNLWLSMGHNVTGFREVDLADDQNTERGLYMRLRFKFDETLLGAWR